MSTPTGPSCPPGASVECGWTACRTCYPPPPNRFERAAEVGVTVHRPTRWCWCNRPDLTTPHNHDPAGTWSEACPARRLAWTVRREPGYWGWGVNAWVVREPGGKIRSVTLWRVVALRDAAHGAVQAPVTACRT